MKNFSFAILLLAACLISCKKKYTCNNTTGINYAVTGKDTILQGDTLTLTAANIPNAQYLWRGPNGFTSINRVEKIACNNGKATGTYSIHYSTLDGCISHDESKRIMVDTVIPCTLKTKTITFDGIDYPFSSAGYFNNYKISLNGTDLDFLISFDNHYNSPPGTGAYRTRDNKLTVDTYTQNRTVVIRIYSDLTNKTYYAKPGGLVYITKKSSTTITVSFCSLDFESIKASGSINAYL